MSLKNAIKPLVLKSIDSATFTGAYQAINPLGLNGPSSLINILNNANVTITVSFDGVTDHIFMIANSDYQASLQNNSQPTAGVAVLPKGTIVYVKGAAGMGLVYLSGFYQVSES